MKRQSPLSRSAAGHRRVAWKCFRAGDMRGFDHHNMIADKLLKRAEKDREDRKIFKAKLEAQNKPAKG